MRRWWGTIVAGLLALLALVTGGGARKWRKRAEKVQAKAEAAGQQDIRERTAEEAGRILEDLERKRAAAGDDRARGALDRARQRRAGGPGAGPSGG